MRPGMSDGRMFTNWKSSCQLNSELQNKNGIKSDTQYRDFLQKNPDKVTKAQPKPN